MQWTEAETASCILPHIVHSVLIGWSARGRQLFPHPLHAIEAGQVQGTRASHPRGAFWLSVEALCLLLTLLQWDEAKEIMRSKGKSTMAIFRNISCVLHAASYTRSATQCHSKFKRMKASFLNCIQAWHEAPPIWARPHFFDILEALWFKGVSTSNAHGGQGRNSAQSYLMNPETRKT